MKHKYAIGAATVIILLLAGMLTFLLSGHGEPKTRMNALFGDSEAQMQIARASFLAPGDARDDEAGASWTIKAAQNGNEGATSLVGVLYMGGIGVEQDLNAAQQWFSASKDPQAQKLAAILDAVKKNIEKLPEDKRAEQEEKSRAAAAEQVRGTFTKIIGGAQPAPQAE